MSFALAPVRCADPVPQPTWRAFLRETLRNGSAWARGSLPPWAVWGSTTAETIAKSISDVIDKGGDRDDIRGSVVGCWEDDLETEEKLWELADGVDAILDRLYGDGILTAERSLVRVPAQDCAITPATQAPNAKRVRVNVAQKYMYLVDFYTHYPSKLVTRCTEAEYLRAHPELAQGQLLNWYKRSRVDRWDLWPPRLRDKFREAPQRIRAWLDRPRKGRRHEDYYPERVVSKLNAGLHRVLEGNNTKGARKKVSCGAIQASVARLIADGNARIAAKNESILRANSRVLRELADGASAQESAAERLRATIPPILGKGSCSFASRFRREHGFGKATQHYSKKELEFNDPEMRRTREEVRGMLKETVPELLLNCDEMWRRQMRDDGSRGLVFQQTHEVDSKVGNPELFVELGPLGFRAAARATHATWHGRWHKQRADVLGEMRALRALVSAQATYQDFDFWQQSLFGHKRKHRAAGRERLAQRPATNPRYDAPPSHRRGRTHITSTFADGSRGPLVIFYGDGKAAVRDVALLNERYAPEVFVRDTGTKSHMSNAQLFLWYLDVPVREALRWQREKLRAQGRHSDARKRAVVLLDPASCHMAYLNGERLRRDELCAELNMEIKEAPAGWSATGQPCDQVHRSIQAKLDNHARNCAGEHNDIFSRPDMYEKTSAGNLVSITTIQEVEGSVAAYRAITRREWCRAWTITGYLTIAEMEATANVDVAGARSKQRSGSINLLGTLAVPNEPGTCIAPPTSLVWATPDESEIAHKWEWCGPHGWSPLPNLLHDPVTREWHRRHKHSELRDRGELKKVKMTEENFQRAGITELHFLSKKEVRGERRTSLLERCADALSSVVLDLRDLSKTSILCGAPGGDVDSGVRPLRRVATTDLQPGPVFEQVIPGDFKVRWRRAGEENAREKADGKKADEMSNRGEGGSGEETAPAHSTDTESQPESDCEDVLAQEEDEAIRKVRDAYKQRRREYAAARGRQEEQQVKRLRGLGFNWLNGVWMCPRSLTGEPLLKASGGDQPRRTHGPAQGGSDGGVDDEASTEQDSASPATADVAAITALDLDIAADAQVNAAAWNPVWDGKLGAAEARICWGRTHAAWGSFPWSLEIAGSRIRFQPAGSGISRGGEWQCRNTKQQKKRIGVAANGGWQASMAHALAWCFAGIADVHGM